MFLLRLPALTIHWRWSSCSPGGSHVTFSFAPEKLQELPWCSAVSIFFLWRKNTMACSMLCCTGSSLKKLGLQKCKGNTRVFPPLWGQHLPHDMLRAELESSQVHWRCWAGSSAVFSSLTQWGGVSSLPPSCAPCFPPWRSLQHNCCYTKRNSWAAAGAATSCCFQSEGCAGQGLLALCVQARVSGAWGTGDDR